MSKNYGDHRKEARFNKLDKILGKDGSNVEVIRQKKVEEVPFVERVSEGKPIFYGRLIRDLKEVGRDVLYKEIGKPEEQFCQKGTEEVEEYIEKILNALIAERDKGIIVGDDYFNESVNLAGRLQKIGEFAQMHKNGYASDPDYKLIQPNELKEKVQKPVIAAMRQKMVSLKIAQSTEVQI